jgi:hypothetical protein
VQVLAPHDHAAALRVRQQVQHGLAAPVQGLEAALADFGQNVARRQRHHLPLRQRLGQRGADLVAAAGTALRIGADAHQRISQKARVGQDRAADVIPDDRPFAVERHRVAPIDQVQRAVRADHDVAGMHIAVDLAVHEHVRQDRVQQPLAHLALEAPARRARHLPHGLDQAARVREVLHLQDAPAAAVELRHAPGQHARAAGVEAALVGSLRVEIQLLHEAGDELVHLLLQRAQERRNLGMRRPVLAGQDCQADHQLADHELAVEVLAADLDHDGLQHLDAVLQERLARHVHRADGAGAHRAGGIETEVAPLGRLAVALEEGLHHLVGAHRRHVLVEHRQLARDLLGQEVGVGRRHLRHLDEERAELADHLRDDARLRAEVLRVGGEERPQVADGADLPAQDGGVAAHGLRAAHQLLQLPLVEAPAGLEQIHHLDQQGLVGAQHQPHHVERHRAHALQLVGAEELVEEAPELLDQGFRDRYRTALHQLVDDEAQQLLGGLLVRDQAAGPQVLGHALCGACHRVGMQRRKDGVDGFRELAARDVLLVREQLHQRAEAPRDAIGLDRERAQFPQQRRRAARACAPAPRRPGERRAHSFPAIGSCSKCPSLSALAVR